VKHVALFAALQHLLSDWPVDREFVYADIHAGRPEYVLPDKGDWRYGVGEFSKLLSIKEDRVRRKRGNRTSLGLVGEFDESIIRREITTGALYAGSSGIAFRLLRESKANFTMLLWEKDRAAADDGERYFYPWRDQVKTICDDGYNLLYEQRTMQLVLIDPPSIEQAPLALKTMEHLVTKNCPFLCWMPRTPKPVQNEDNWSSEEAATSKDYRSKAAKIGSCLPILWKEKWGPGPGCSITFSQELDSVIAPAVRKVTEMMKWKSEE